MFQISEFEAELEVKRRATADLRRALAQAAQSEAKLKTAIRRQATDLEELKAGLREREHKYEDEFTGQ
jgi:septal ring factor EnvC (AmiA/AmiB activator)